MAWVAGVMYLDWQLLKSNVVIARINLSEGGLRHHFVLETWFEIGY